MLPETPYHCGCHPCICGNCSHHDSTETFTAALGVPQESPRLMFHDWEMKSVQEPEENQLGRTLRVRLFRDLPMPVWFWLPEHFPPHVPAEIEPENVPDPDDGRTQSHQQWLFDMDASVSPVRSSTPNTDRVSQADPSELFDLQTLSPNHGQQAGRGHKRRRMSLPQLPFLPSILVSDLNTAARTPVPQSPDELHRPAKLTRLSTEQDTSTAIHRPQWRSPPPLPRDSLPSQYPRAQTPGINQNIRPILAPNYWPTPQMQTCRPMNTSPQLGLEAYPGNDSVALANHLNRYSPSSRHLMSPGVHPVLTHQANMIRQKGTHTYSTAVTYPSTSRHMSPNDNSQSLVRQTLSEHPSPPPVIRQETAQTQIPPGHPPPSLVGDPFSVPGGDEANPYEID